MSSFSTAFSEMLPVLADLAAPSAGRDSDAPFERVVCTLIGSQIGEAAVAHWRQSFQALDAATPETLVDLDPSEVEQCLGSRPTNTTRTLARTLQRLAASVLELGGTQALETASIERLRESWRAISGIGNATADRLFLALGKPAYPVDRATYRVLVRHGWLDSSASYEEAQEVISSATESDPALMLVVSRAMEQIGARWCKAARPNCGACPLAPWLPERGVQGEI